MLQYINSSLDHTSHAMHSNHSIFYVQFSYYNSLGNQEPQITFLKWNSMKKINFKKLYEEHLSVKVMLHFLLISFHLFLFSLEKLKKIMHFQEEIIDWNCFLDVLSSRQIREVPFLINNVYYGKSTFCWFAQTMLYSNFNVQFSYYNSFRRPRASNNIFKMKFLVGN